VPLCPHDDVVYREPTPLERAFLALVTRAHPGFARQVEHVVVGDYDPTGWCFTRIENADVAPVRDHADGPTLRRNRPNEKPIYIETILWPDARGLLEAVEFIDFHRSIENGPYALFLEAERFGEIVEPGSAA